MSNFVKNFWFQVAVVFVVISMPLYINTFSIRNSSVTACQRGNAGVRTPLFDFLESAQQARLESADSATDKNAKQTDLQAAKQYKGEADQMVEAAGDLAITPGRPEVNCEEAFPKPWPF
jgi:hypothetical protein